MTVNLLRLKVDRANLIVLRSHPVLVIAVLLKRELTAKLKLFFEVGNILLSAVAKLS